MSKVFTSLVLIFFLTTVIENNSNRIRKRDRWQVDVQHNTIVNVDNIRHQIIDRRNANWRRINEFERDFKRLIFMDGFKFQFKRDMYWRTWREVTDLAGNKMIVAYKCNNVVPLNCTNCSGGYWVMERKLPCPFELFSLSNNDELCAFNYMEYENGNSTCPVIVTFGDLTGTCDNPIETEWRITKTYSTNSTEKVKNDICNTDCQIATTYVIRRNYVIFRIINESNDVIYSRVMQKGGKNYACVKNCGHRDPVTMIVKSNARALP